MQASQRDFPILIDNVLTIGLRGDRTDKPPTVPCIKRTGGVVAFMRPKDHPPVPLRLGKRQTGVMQPLPKPLPPRFGHKDEKPQARGLVRLAHAGNRPKAVAAPLGDPGRFTRIAAVKEIGHDPGDQRLKTAVIAFLARVKRAMRPDDPTRIARTQPADRHLGRVDQIARTVQRIGQRRAANLGNQRRKRRARLRDKAFKHARALPGQRELHLPPLWHPIDQPFALQAADHARQLRLIQPKILRHDPRRHLPPRADLVDQPHFGQGAPGVQIAATRQAQRPGVKPVEVADSVDCIHCTSMIGCLIKSSITALDRNRTLRYPMEMSINSPSDVAANLQIGPTDAGMVRIYIEAEGGVELPLDFDPEEADEIAEELRAAAEAARAMGAGGNKPKKR